jgi:hypothetical protein
MSNVLRTLKENNEYPIVFIGSGMSRRFLLNFPGWEAMLLEFWDALGTGKDFYGFLSTIKRSIGETHEDTEYDLDFITNIAAGSEVENRFNSMYFSESLMVPGFTQEQAYKTGISPFKVAVANRFASYEVKPDMLDEYESFKGFLNKTQIVITTNYDTFIEDSINSNHSDGIKRYIGQKGFFEPTSGWAEIYKIHGCVTDPRAIVISKADYDLFSKNSILISAKIISMLINSPIIFMGYSLTDGNVRKIIRDFSSSLTKEELKQMASKIIIIERKEGINEIVEQTYYDKDLCCEYTVLQTDNYKLIYEILTEIDQGIHPSEVRKYQHVIKKLIVNRGKRGSLNTLLVSPEDLKDIENRIGDEKLVVALGDATYIFQMPDLISYLFDYFSGERTIQTDIALRFIANQGTNSRLPIIKHIDGIDLDSTSLHPSEVERLKQRINNFTGPEMCMSSIHASYKIRIGSLSEIIAGQHKPEKEYDIVAYNALRINKDELAVYIREKLLKFKKDGVRSLPTSMRRLLTICDFIENKRG